MSTHASSGRGPYRHSTPGNRRLSGIDVGGLAITVALLGSGLIPVFGAITSGDVTSGSAHLGFVVVLGSVLLILRELRLARRKRDPEESDEAPARTETPDD